MNIKQERKFIQQLLEEGQIDTLSVQVIALNIFANSIGYKAVDGDIRKGFVGYDHKTWNVTHNISLEEMQYRFNHGLYPWESTVPNKIREEKNSKRIVNRVSLQYNKRTTKQLTTQLEWLNFVKED
ncbi:hypothetical protein [Aeromonas phage 4L372D]|uniref:DUF7390 domain-containing protein n=2 Tax=Plateaulakevirus TaxID=2843436 RepID=A0A5B9N957_9CAUD|nr:hypothetical protein HWC25_gp062 [Aeromonas phage 2L372D]YP_009846634.1 hypothetical protein HWC27_gp086 [Aeromonas phage 4L372D]QDB73976.1 hypothetical protein 2L372D_062 [Aeromonas phage 2L372D]QEG08550.1 hypothetical protein [Aeromonas phage 4L372D]